MSTSSRWYTTFSSLAVAGSTSTIATLSRPTFEATYSFLLSAVKNCGPNESRNDVVSTGLNGAFGSSRYRYVLLTPSVAIA